MSKKIAYSKEELPKLQEGYVRVVHVTKAPQEYVDSIREEGLKYEFMLSTTARWWGDEDEVDYTNRNDPRFTGHGAKAIVLDVPMEEVRRVHDNMTKAPGVVPSKYIVGIIDVSKEAEQKKPSKLERNVGGGTAIIGILASFFFLSSNLTGNVISNLSLLTSNLLGLLLFFIGLIGGFFYFRSTFN